MPVGVAISHADTLTAHGHRFACGGSGLAITASLDTVAAAATLPSAPVGLGHHNDRQRHKEREVDLLPVHGHQWTFGFASRTRIRIRPLGAGAVQAEAAFDAEDTWHWGMEAEGGDRSNASSLDQRPSHRHRK